MINWLDSALPFLEAEKYSEVVKIYEELVQNNEENVGHYWYLGLAYLLNEDIDSAQTTWFIVFSQGDDSQLEEWNQELGKILDQEALRLLFSGRYEKSLLIRQQIQEITPNNIHNLLHIINLKLLLKTFEIHDLINYNLIKLVKNSSANSLDFVLLSTILKDILYYPYNVTVDFAESVLIYTDVDKEIVQLIVNVGDNRTNEGKYIFYGIELMEMCNKYSHKNIRVYINLFEYYKLVHNFDRVLAIAQEAEKKAESFVEKYTVNNSLLNTYLMLAEWEKARNIAKKQEDIYQQIHLYKNELSDSLIRSSFFSWFSSPYYLSDDPKNNRKKINTVASLFQEINYPFYPHITHTKPQQKKVLTIGYIGHTLRRHSVGYLARWLIYYHDQDLFKINLYFPQGTGDDWTEKWFTPNVHKIVNSQQNIAALVEQIHQDEVDILVDVDSLTYNLTALTMAMKSAPIQVTWLGMDASGIPNIDYFIADPYVLPDHAQEYYSEKIWRLPHTYLAIDGFEIGVPTLRREDLNISDDAIIYLNVQHTAKLHPDLICLQMAIIKQVPNSYLIFKIRLEEDKIRKYLELIAQKCGVNQDQLRFISTDPTVEEHRANLSIADVLLDTYPYNGATTTLEALWCELPVVTRVGEQFAARNTYGFMMNAGIEEGIAWSDEEYIEWGIKLGTDENLRLEVVWKLKQSKQNSLLWNGKQFAREMEKAYQQMWDIYVNQETKAKMK
ncbi:hypothetical protein GM3708_1459 [Geminocystis sp. NIES-3708]|uniref:O-linked N-acetylglucosamine transferase, SPINDLY family protein n=1 Tax=Geminocystis sp. NIES-3708 TaxID=1615909 RepID=UPI0005FC929C|nr:hypothetical protein [Geminocystis sp. NIES-3708]BAQ61053.1 hypothetical protein GM3708_1459 [Geminocystis sp. NIES-3708]